MKAMQKYCLIMYIPHIVASKYLRYATQKLDFKLYLSLLKAFSFIYGAAISKE